MTLINDIEDFEDVRKQIDSIFQLTPEQKNEFIRLVIAIHRMSKKQFIVTCLCCGKISLEDQLCKCKNTTYHYE
jgi:hypothetical protein